MENIIRTELSEEIGPDVTLGIEWAHRALWLRPPDNATPRSRVLHFTTKEKVVHAAWKKPIAFEEKQVNFDHNYTTVAML